MKKLSKREHINRCLLSVLKTILFGRKSTYGSHVCKESSTLNSMMPLNNCKKTKMRKKKKSRRKRKVQPSHLVSAASFQQWASEMASTNLKAGVSAIKMKTRANKNQQTNLLSPKNNNKLQSSPPPQHPPPNPSPQDPKRCASAKF